MEYLLAIITFLIGLWTVSWFIADAYNKQKFMKSLYHVSAKFDDDGDGVAGEDVRIVDYTSNSHIYVETIDRYKHGNIPLHYLKKIKNLKEKGGEKKVKRMPRLWKWLIVYIPLAILVWDLVTNINNIVLYLTPLFLHR